MGEKLVENVKKSDMDTFYNEKVKIMKPRIRERDNFMESYALEDPHSSNLCLTRIG
ncbi:unnamed protein product, partial [Dovyalis caffra]